MIAEATDTYFRTLQIAKQAYIATRGQGSLTQRRGTATVLVSITVREIETCDSHPGFNHAAEYLSVV
jgi:hypothetical protein